MCVITFYPLNPPDLHQSRSASLLQKVGLQASVLLYLTRTMFRTTCHS